MITDVYIFMILYFYVYIFLFQAEKCHIRINLYLMEISEKLPVIYPAFAFKPPGNNSVYLVEIVYRVKQAELERTKVQVDRYYHLYTCVVLPHY